MEKLLLVAPSGKQDKRKETAAQRATRTSFAEASRWAKSVLVDPKQKKYYQRRAKEWNVPNAYTAAVKDYMRKLKGKGARNHDHALIKNNDALLSAALTSYRPHEIGIDLIAEQACRQRQGLTVLDLRSNAGNLLETTSRPKCFHFLLRSLRNKNYDAHKKSAFTLGNPLPHVVVGVVCYIARGSPKTALNTSNLN